MAAISPPPSEIFLFRPHPEGDQLPLLVVFSGTRAETFTFFKRTQGLPCSVLYLRDPHLKNWYQQGLTPNGHLDDIDEVIRQYQKPGQPLYCLGSSMGGYAALYFGLRLKARRVLALSPQIVLSPVIPRSPTSIRVSVDNLIPYLSAPDEVETHLLFGGNDMIDLFQAFQFDPRGPGIHASSLIGGAHNIAGRLDRDNLLQPLFRDFILHRPFDFGPHPILKIEDYEPRQADLVKQIVPLFYEKEYDTVVELLQTYLETHPDWALGYSWLGLAAVRSERFRSIAVNASARAVRLEPEFLDFIFEAGLIAVELEDDAACAAYLDRLQKLDPLSPFSRRLSLARERKTGGG